MVLIGQTIQAYKELGCEHLIRFAKLVGMEACEINPQGVNLKNVDKIINALGNMKTTFHLPVAGIEGYDFAYPEKKKEINEVIRVINENFEKLNIVLGVFHPVEEHGDFDTLVKNLKKLKIPLVVENIEYLSDEEFIEEYSKFKKVLGNQLKGWLYDAAHSFLRNGPLKFLDLLDKLPFNELIEIHLSDCTEGEDSHYSFGAGIMPVEKILQEFRRRKFKGIIVNEIDAYPSVWDSIESYREVAKNFKKTLYFSVSLRKSIIKPFIKRRLKSADII